MPVSVNHDITPRTKPTWGLVVVLVLTLAVETAADVIGHLLTPDVAPPFEECFDLCTAQGGYVAAVGPATCACAMGEDP